MNGNRTFFQLYGVLIVIVLLICAVLLNFFGQKGGILGLERQYLWLWTAGLFVISFLILGKAVHNRFSGVLIDRDNRISLSRFQIVIWTLVLVSSLFTAGIGNAVLPIDKFDEYRNQCVAKEGGEEEIAACPEGPLDINIPPEVWALLGLGALSAVAAPAIKENQRTAPFRGKKMGSQAESLSKANPGLNQEEVAAAVVVERIQAERGLAEQGAFDARVYANAAATEARWIDLITGDYEGAADIDISKVQQLAFTILLASIYALAIWVMFSMGGAFIDAFPPVSSGFVALLGISHAAYLADKQAAPT